jgi:hypothetical protein
MCWGFMLVAFFFVWGSFSLLPPLQVSFFRVRERKKCCFAAAAAAAAATRLLLARKKERKKVCNEV